MKVNEESCDHCGVVMDVSDPHWLLIRGSRYCSMSCGPVDDGAPPLSKTTTSEATLRERRRDLDAFRRSGRLILKIFEAEFVSMSKTGHLPEKEIS